MRTQKKDEVIYSKRGKMHVTKLRLVYILLLIGWEGGKNFLDQSRSVLGWGWSSPKKSLDTRLHTWSCRWQNGATQVY